MNILSGLLSILLLLISSHSWASPLSVAANALQPGNWVELTTNNLVSVLAIGQVAPDYVIQYCDDAVWDANSGNYYIGSRGHTTTVPGSFIRLNENTNTWTKEADFGQPTDWAHCYDHLAIDSVRHRVLYRNYDTTNIYEYSIAGGSWSQSIPSWNGGVHQVAGVLENFDTLDSLIFIDGDWGIFKYTRSSGQWSTLGSTNAGGQFPMGSYSNVGKYNNITNTMIFGGGAPCFQVSPCSNRLYRLQANGTITRQGDSPMNMAISDASHAAIVTVDPNTGHFLIAITNDGTTAKWWDYNDATDQWIEITSSAARPPFFTIHGADGPVYGVVCSPIYNYLVTMCVGGQPGFQHVWLYKHAASTPPQTLIGPSSLIVNVTP